MKVKFSRSEKISVVEDGKVVPNRAHPSPQTLIRADLQIFSESETQSSTRRAARVSPVAPMTGEPAAKKMEGPPPSNPSKSSKPDHPLGPPSNPSKWGGGLGPPSNPSKCPSKPADAPGPYPPPLAVALSFKYMLTDGRRSTHIRVSSAARDIWPA